MRVCYAEVNSETYSRSRFKEKNPGMMWSPSELLNNIRVFSHRSISKESHLHPAPSLPKPISTVNISFSALQTFSSSRESQQFCEPHRVLYSANLSRFLFLCDTMFQ